MPLGGGMFRLQTTIFFFYFLICSPCIGLTVTSRELVTSPQEISEEDVYSSVPIFLHNKYHSVFFILTISHRNARELG